MFCELCAELVQVAIQNSAAMRTSEIMHSSTFLHCMHLCDFCITKRDEPQKMQVRVPSEKGGKATSACGPRNGCVGLDSNLNPCKRTGKPERHNIGGSAYNVMGRSHNFM